MAKANVDLPNGTKILKMQEKHAHNRYGRLQQGNWINLIL